ncbi:MAG TPA: hypothetical protein VEX14_15335 [Burkholderiaceae bacterium]|nr:hypothetical protein [Burkholderiaceae bacterium]
MLRSTKRLDSVGSPNNDGFGFISGTSQSLAMSGDGHYVVPAQPDNAFVKGAFAKARGAAPLDHLVTAWR